MCQLNDSQSAAAKNSANVVVRYIDVRPKGGNYKWQVEKINAINEFFNAEFFSDDFESARVEIIVNSKEVFPRLYMGDIRLQPENNKPFMAKNSGAGMFKEMNDMVTTMAVIYDMLECDFYPFPAVKYEWKEDFLKERGLEVYMTLCDENPELDEAPVLEAEPCLNDLSLGLGDSYWSEAPALDEDDDTTEEGYSVAGLKYLAENMPVVPVDAIVEGVNEYFSDCYAVARNRCMGFYECSFEEFCDIVWSYVWPNVMTDEALEAETRYYMEFNDRLRYMLDNGDLGALYIYNQAFVRSRFDEEAEVAA